MHDDERGGSKPDRNRANRGGMEARAGKGESPRNRFPFAKSLAFCKKRPIRVPPAPERDVFLGCGQPAKAPDVRELSRQGCHRRKNPSHFPRRGALAR